MSSKPDNLKADSISSSSMGGAPSVHSASTAGIAGLGAGSAAAAPGVGGPGSAPGQGQPLQLQQQGAVTPVIKNVDMTEEMQQSVIEIAGAALAQFSVEKDVAAHVKRTLDSQFGPTWHAVVGKNYGSYVTHERRHFIYFYLGPIAFLLWRA
ncbi:Dynein light chain [Tilletia horrida]|nr:Dynein light chain [Tilletia horrida]